MNVDVCIGTTTGKSWALEQKNQLVVVLSSRGSGDMTIVSHKGGWYLTDNGFDVRIDETIGNFYVNEDVYESNEKEPVRACWVCKRIIRERSARYCQDCGKQL